jgi:hypothetical protein
VKKIAQTVAQSVLCQNKKKNITFNVGKRSPKLGATSAFSQKLPKVNGQSLGENSPYLVTLVEAGQCKQLCSQPGH